MPPSEDDSPVKPTHPLAASVVRSANRDSVVDFQSLAQSEASLPFRRAATSSSASAAVFSSTQTPPTSRPISPVNSGSPIRPFSASTFDSGGSTLVEQASGSPNDPLNLIIQAFVPHVAVFAAEDTDRLARDKGFDRGLWELLRPFGQNVQGKVTVRDSNGFSHSYDDFSIRFVKFRDDQDDALIDTRTSSEQSRSQLADSLVLRAESAGRLGESIAEAEAVVERHLAYAEESVLGIMHNGTPTRASFDVGATSPYYALFLRRLLAGTPLAPHETFAHPVACVIAISSRNPSPIEALRRLYDETSRGQGRLPRWVDPEYLRYYVLVHDEERDDIARSMTLFDQMKRHFGLHCHLLRLRGSQTAQTDDESVPCPPSDWMTAREELDLIRRSEIDQDDGHVNRLIFDSDATAIRQFVREMVTQSILPTMERHIHTWNDQVASRRRGLSGRFMSLSRRWGGGSSSSSSTNYDPAGFYRPGSPEAVMRKLADFAFMLRDWKLAQSTYDLLRADFLNDKAWHYHAAANEMAAISLLVAPRHLANKSRMEAIGRMMEAAYYSYHTRSAAPYGALRALLLCMELLRLRGGSFVDDAARWGVRLIESRILGAVGDALVKERVAACHASKPGIGSQAWGSRRRKAALWSILAAEAWVDQSKFIQAQRCLNDARNMYAALPHDNGISGFAAADAFMAGLQRAVKMGMTPPAGAGAVGDTQGGDGDSAGGVAVTIDEEEEVTLDEPVGGPLGHGRRRSSVLRIPGTTLDAPIETSPLRSRAGPSELSFGLRAPDDEFR